MFFDRPESGEIAVLVCMSIQAERDLEDSTKEFEELAISAGASPAAVITGSLKQVTSRFFIGTGKLEQLKQEIALHQAEVVLFNHTLSPSQERNLETDLNCRVLDRTALILDIFAQRARSYEGKLQVELAQLKHSVSRLVKGWTHLDRQKGGIGLRGAGETQLEIDQRLIAVRIKSINKSLSKVRNQRQQGRKARQRAEVPTVSLVGYTNAGKSSLFNHLCNSEIYVADQLFATLDSTMRKIQVSGYGPAILADTVGFISNLPHQLVSAFRATLEESTEASLLLHVIDYSNEQRQFYEEQVNNILAEIGAEDIPTLLVYNKVDLVEQKPTKIMRDENGVPRQVWVSAVTGSGIDLLHQAIAELLAEDLIEPEITLQPQHGRLRAQFYHLEAVINESITDNGNIQLSLRLPQHDFIRLMKEAELDPKLFINLPETNN